MVLTNLTALVVLGSVVLMVLVQGVLAVAELRRERAGRAAGDDQVPLGSPECGDAHADTAVLSAGRTGWVSRPGGSAAVRPDAASAGA